MRDVAFVWQVGDAEEAMESALSEAESLKRQLDALQKQVATEAHSHAAAEVCGLVLASSVVCRAVLPLREHCVSFELPRSIRARIQMPAFA